MDVFSDFLLKSNEFQTLFRYSKENLISGVKKVNLVEVKYCFVNIQFKTRNKVNLCLFSLPTLPHSLIIRIYYQYSLII